MKRRKSMTKATEDLPSNSSTLNRRRVLTRAVTAAAAVAGAAVSHVAIAAPAPQATAPVAPVFKLTPAASELLALEEQWNAAHAAFKAIPSGDEWSAARERSIDAREAIAAEMRKRSKAIVGQLIREPVTADSLVSLAAAAQNYPSARAILMCAVLQLAGVRDLPLDLFWQPDIV
jgi:hypothetical protein